LRRIFGRKNGKVSGGWRKFRNEELHNSYFSPNISRVIISSIISSVGHVACFEGM